MNQGQATVEYLSLVLVGLVAACMLVRVATPVEQLALAVAHTIVPVRHRAHPAREPAKHHRRRHSKKRPCTCVFRLNLAGSGPIDSGNLLPVPPVTGGLKE